MYEDLYLELEKVLKKFKYAYPPTGYGHTRIEIDVDVSWVDGEIIMVDVNTKNRNPNQKRK